MVKKSCRPAPSQRAAWRPTSSWRHRGRNEESKTESCWKKIQRPTIRWDCWNSEKKKTCKDNCLILALTCRAPLHKASIHGFVVVVKINPPPCATRQTVALRDREGLRYPQTSKLAGLEVWNTKGCECHKMSQNTKCFRGQPHSTGKLCHLSAKALRCWPDTFNDSPPFCGKSLDLEQEHKYSKYMRYRKDS